jgi:hypothetical protein
MGKHLNNAVESNENIDRKNLPLFPHKEITVALTARFVTLRLSGG